MVYSFEFANAEFLHSSISSGIATRFEIRVFLVVSFESRYPFIPWAEIAKFPRHPSFIISHFGERKEEKPDMACPEWLIW